MSDHEPRRPVTDGDDLFADVSANVNPPTELRDQVVGALRAQGLIRGMPPSRPPLAYWAVAAAAVVVAFLGGRASADVRAPVAAGAPDVGDERDIAVTRGTPELAVPEGSSAWAFLLYEDGRFDAGDRSPEEIARLYDAWASRAAEAGVMLVAEKFVDEETLLAGGEAITRPLGVAAPPGMLGGMFVVAAPTPEAALGLARETPHHEMGGIVLVREIDRGRR